MNIDEVILQESNPFDPITFVSGNFWQENQEAIATVESIHQEAIIEIKEMVETIITDPQHHSRSVILKGDAGVGKSYFLGRIKLKLQDKAFFVYIPTFVDRQSIWRHTLRDTIDSLMCIPSGQQESQLILLLKSLPASGEKEKFVRDLKTTFPDGIYNAGKFFGVLYHLTNPELYQIACEWLSGDDLAEEHLKTLGVKSIDNERMAMEILSNFGRISSANRPIVLCFDQLESFRDQSK